MTYSPELLAAVAVLDADSPGWHRKIDLGIFELHPGACVLAQTYGQWMQGDTFHATLKQLRVHGPLDSMVLAPGGGNEDQWRSLISERQAADQNIQDTFAVDRMDMIEGVAV
jgi:hypothetical protein